MVAECVRQRMQEVDQTGAHHEPQGSGGPSDLLTLLLKERQTFKGSEDELTEEEIVNQVSLRAFERRAQEFRRRYPLTYEAPHFCCGRPRDYRGNSGVVELHPGEEFKYPGQAPKRDSRRRHKQGWRVASVGGH
jgi:hypothetical protein